MKRIFIFLPLLLLLPVLALGQDRFNEVGAVYGAIRSMTPEAYKEAHDKYGIRWIEAWTGNLTGGTEEQYDAWIERFNTAMKGSGLKLWSVLECRLAPFGPIIRQIIRCLARKRQMN